MNILFMCTGGPPLPHGTGHQVHNSGNIECLIHLGHQVDLIILSKNRKKSKEDILKIKKYHPNLNSCQNIILRERKKLSLNTLKLYDIFKELIKIYFHPIHYFTSKNYASVCNEISSVILNNKIDIIWYEDFYVGVYDFLLNKNIPIIYNMHDIQANTYKNRNISYFNNKNSFSNMARRVIVNVRYQALKNTEIKLQKISKVVLSGSSTDVKYLKGRGVNSIFRKIYIKGGPELSLKKRENFIENKIFNEKKLKITHIGSVDGSFTSVSLLWFMNEIWPQLLKDLNNYNLELNIIGGGKPSLELKQSFDKPNVLYRGYVDNIWDELVDSFLVVVPGKLITGVRIRVPTIFSMMVPAIGNKVSFDGMFKNNNVHGALFAENIHQYSKNIRMLASDHDYYLKTCKDAMEFYLNNHSLKGAAKDINDIIKGVMV